MRRWLALTILFIGCAGYLGLAVTVLRSALDAEQTQVWPGYYSVLVASERPVEQAEQALRQAGFGETLSSHSAQVDFHSFDRVESVSVAELRGRFDSLDPRVDPFMERLPGLFRASINDTTYQLIYVRSDEPPLTVLPRISRALAAVGIEARYPSWQPLASAAAVGLALLFCGIVVWRSAKRRLVVAAGALPWLLTAAVGGVESLPVVLPLFFSWAYAAEIVVPAYREIFRARRPHFDGGSLVTRTLFFAGAVTAAIGLTQLTPDMVNVVPAAAAAVVLFFAAAAGEAYRALVTEHRVFTPVSIRRRDMFRKIGDRSAYQPALPWLLIIALAAPFLTLLLPEDSVPLMPQPQRVGAVTDISPEALRQLWDREAQSELPSLAAYVAHRAYQSSFMYGGSYHLPEPGAAVTLPRFVTSNGSMRRVQETVVAFDQQWYRNVTAAVEAVSLPGLLSHGGSPGGVVRERVQRLYWHPLNVVRQLSLVLLVFAPISIAQGILSVPIRRAAIGEFARRRRQAA
jgi:hypothetical protein